MNSDDQTLPVDFAQRLRAARKAHKPPLTQQGLAERLGVSRPTVVSWENGKIPSEANLESLRSVEGFSGILENDPDEVDRVDQQFKKLFASILRRTSGEKKSAIIEYAKGETPNILEIIRRISLSKEDFNETNPTTLDDIKKEYHDFLINPYREDRNIFGKYCFVDLGSFLYSNYGIITVTSRFPDALQSNVISLNFNIRGHTVLLVNAPELKIDYNFFIAKALYAALETNQKAGVTFIEYGDAEKFALVLLNSYITTYKFLKDDKPDSNSEDKLRDFLRDLILMGNNDPIDMITFLKLINKGELSKKLESIIEHSGQPDSQYDGVIGPDPSTLPPVNTEPFYLDTNNRRIPRAIREDMNKTL